MGPELPLSKFTICNRVDAPRASEDFTGGCQSASRSISVTTPFSSPAIRSGQEMLSLSQKAECRVKCKPDF